MLLYCSLPPLLFYQCRGILLEKESHAGRWHVEKFVVSHLGLSLGITSQSFVFSHSLFSFPSMTFTSYLPLQASYSTPVPQRMIKKIKDSKHDFYSWIQTFPRLCPRPWTLWSPTHSFVVTEPRVRCLVAVFFREAGSCLTPVDES